MGLSCRVFLLGKNDDLYRLPNNRFEQMLRDPAGHCFPRFAGTRVRMATVVVELQDRQPIRVVWTSHSILTFNREGYFGTRSFDRHQRARAELAFAPQIAKPHSAVTVVDAVSQFVNRGGRWTPSTTLARRIDEAAMGHVKCLLL
jgi:hypothetical protein